MADAESSPVVLPDSEHHEQHDETDLVVPQEVASLEEDGVEAASIPAGTESADAEMSVEQNGNENDADNVVAEELENGATSDESNVNKAALVDENLDAHPSVDESKEVEASVDEEMEQITTAHVERSASPSPEEPEAQGEALPLEESANESQPSNSTASASVSTSQRQAISVDAQPEASFDPNVVEEVSVKFGVVKTPDIRIILPTSIHRSTWINVDPPRPKHPRDKIPTQSAVLPKVVPTPEVVEPEPEPQPEPVPESSEPKKTKRRRKSLKRTEPLIEEEHVSEDEVEPEPEVEDNTFDVDFVHGHRYTKKKNKRIIEYLVRWLNYGPEADTWEPESNIIGDTAKKMVEEYWEKKKSTPRKTPGRKRKSGAVAPVAPVVEPVEAPEPVVVEPVAEEVAIEPTATVPSPSPLPPAPAAAPPPPPPPPPIDETASGFEVVADHNDWYGIREEDARNKQAKREFKNLYVADRIPSLSERLLAETAGTGRVTRSSLKPLKGDDGPPRASKTPEPPRRRRRVTTSPGAANRTASESPTKRGRKSVPISRSIYVEVSSSESPEVEFESEGIPSSRSPSPGPSTSTAMPRKRASEMGAPPSRSISRGSSLRRSGTVVSPPKTPRAAPAPSEDRASIPSDAGETYLRGGSIEFNVAVPPKKKKKPGIMDSDNRKRKHGVTDWVESNEREEGYTDDDIAMIGDDDDEDEDDDVEMIEEEEDDDEEEEEESDSSEDLMDENGRIRFLTHKHFNVLKTLDLEALLSSEAPLEQAPDYDNLPKTKPRFFDPEKVVGTLEEFFDAVEALDVKCVYSTLETNGLAECDLNEKDEKGWTLMHRLVQIKCDDTAKHVSVLTMLLRHGGCDLTICDPDGRTALHLAVLASNVCVAKTLVEFQSPINTFDVNHESPLIVAIRNNECEIIRTLFLNGGNFYRVNRTLDAYNHIIPSIREFVTCHRNKIIEAMDVARMHVFPQTTNNLKKTLESTLFVKPLHESEVIEYDFVLKMDPDMIAPNNYLFYEIGVLGMTPEGDDFPVRMWQQSPVRSILINNVEPVYMHKTTNFISLPKLVKGRNKVHIDLMNQVYKNTNFCVVGRLSHIFMLGYHRPSRVEPTIGNLMPLSMGNPPNGRAQLIAPPAVTLLSAQLHPRYYRDPNAEVVRHTPPVIQPVRRIPSEGRQNPLTIVRGPVNFSQQAQQHNHQQQQQQRQGTVPRFPSQTMARPRIQSNRVQYGAIRRSGSPLPPRLVHVDSNGGPRRVSPPHLGTPYPSNSNQSITAGPRSSVPASNVVQPVTVGPRNSVPEVVVQRPDGAALRQTPTSREQSVGPIQRAYPTPVSAPQSYVRVNQQPQPSMPSTDVASAPRPIPFVRGVPNGFRPYHHLNRNRSLLTRQNDVRHVTRPVATGTNITRPVVRQTQRFISPGPNSFQRVSSAASAAISNGTTVSGRTPYHPLNYPPAGRRRMTPPPVLTPVTESAQAAQSRPMSSLARSTPSQQPQFRPMPSPGLQAQPRPTASQPQARPTPAPLSKIQTRPTLENMIP